MADTNYVAEARSDAEDMAVEFLDQIVEQLIEDDEASDDLYNDYPNGDSYHHETHVDKHYNLSDAAEVIDQLSDYEETDSGLWDGQQPKEAIGTCAAFTYGNAVMSDWQDIISDINGDAEVTEMVEKYKAAKEAEEEDIDEQSDDYPQEEAAFLACIAENPSDTTNRLVYADWLDDHGLDSDTIRENAAKMVDVPSLDEIKDAVRNIIKGDG